MKAYINKRWKHQLWLGSITAPVDSRARNYVSGATSVLLDYTFAGCDMETECMLSNAASLQLSALVERIITFRVILSFIFLPSIPARLWGAHGMGRTSSWSKRMNFEDNIETFPLENFCYLISKLTIKLKYPRQHHIVILDYDSLGQWAIYPSIHHLL